jgi:hypothetical protein
MSNLPLIIEYYIVTIGQIMADVPSGLSLTPPQETLFDYLFTITFHRTGWSGGNAAFLR